LSSSEHLDAKLYFVLLQRWIACGAHGAASCAFDQRLVCGSSSFTSGRISDQALKLVELDQLENTQISSMII